MAAPQSAHPPDTERGGFFSHATELVGAAWSYLRARFELATIEGREAGVNWLKALALLLGGLIVAVFGYFFFWFALIFALGKAFGGGWAWVAVTFAAALLHLGAGAGLFLKVRALVKEPLFPVTIEEFRKDQSWLDAKTANRS